ncbi:hypothetical protein PMAYCL1PPCAC_24941, partial [Pristionchus mayeri]
PDNSHSGVIRFEVDKVSTLNFNGQDSPEIEVGGVPWKVNVCKQHLNGGGHLGVYLTSFTNFSRLWSIEVDYEISLFNSESSKTVVFKVRVLLIYNIHLIKECAQFRINMLFYGKGFVNDDKITVEVHFAIIKMRGIRLPPHFDFTDPKEPSHDAALVFGGEKIYVSKQILCSHSPVFYAMFFGEFAEKNKEEIELKDIDSKEFLEMLNVIYPSYKKITDVNVHFLLKLGDR